MYYCIRVVTSQHRLHNYHTTSKKRPWSMSTGLINFIGCVGFRVEDDHSTSLWFMKGPEPWTHRRLEKDSCFSHFLDDKGRQASHLCNKIWEPKVDKEIKGTTNKPSHHSDQTEQIVQYYTIATACSEPGTNYAMDAFSLL